FVFLSTLSWLPRFSPVFPYTTLFRSHATQNSNFVGSLPSWWFALRLKAFITGLSLKGTLNGLPYAPHPRTNSLRIFYCYLFLFRDRKSTRLNSSHVSISYAVLCLYKI